MSHVTAVLKAGQIEHLPINSTLFSKKCNEQNKNCTLDCTLDEIQVLNLLKKDNKLTQKKISENIKKSEITVKTITSSLKMKGLLG